MAFPLKGPGAEFPGDSNKLEWRKAEMASVNANCSARGKTLFSRYHPESFTKGKCNTGTRT
jgi:hypothetical protein